MTVYGEYLFLENFITGLLLLYFTARLTGCRGSGFHQAKSWRLVLGAVLCGADSFMLFLPIGTLTAVFLRGLTAVCICLTALGKQEILKKTGIFFSLSFLSGGAAMAFFLWQQVPALSGNGVLYLESMTYVKLICCGIPAMGLAAWFVKLVKRQHRLQRSSGEVVLELGGRTSRLRAYVDSGNCLKEPLTGRPVILVDEKGSRQLHFAKEDYPDRFTAIPYQTVGTEKGMLTGIRLDRMDFGGKETRGAVLAYYQGSFDGFEVLLNEEILEGGL